MQIMEELVKGFPRENGFIRVLNDYGATRGTLRIIPMRERIQNLCFHKFCEDLWRREE